MFAYHSGIAMLTICGYSCLLGGILLVMGSVASKLSGAIKSPSDNALGGGFLSSLDRLRVNLLPFVLLFVILAMMLAMMIQYQAKITAGQLSTNFYLFMNLNIIILCIQALVLGFAEAKEGSNEMSRMFSTFSVFLWIFNLLFYIIQYNEVVYFTTDG
jgi:surface polysaccharide O-acyltransferase-like enzyme